MEPGPRGCCMEHKGLPPLRRRFWRCARIPQHWFLALAAAGTPPALAQDSEPVLATLPRDLTPWGMYLNADPVVKGVLIGLAIASVVTWTVWLAKTVEILLARRRVRASLNLLAGIGRPTEGLERLAGIEGEVRQFLAAAVAELKAGSLEHDGIKERIASRLERLEAAYGRRISRGTGVLAT